MLNSGTFPGTLTLDGARAIVDVTMVSKALILDSYTIEILPIITGLNSSSGIEPFSLDISFDQNFFPLDFREPLQDQTLNYGEEQLYRLPLLYRFPIGLNTTLSIDDSDFMDAVTLNAEEWFV